MLKQIRRRLYWRCGDQKQFFLDPANAYSEVLEKSTGGPRMRKEVFEHSALRGF